MRVNKQCQRVNGYKKKDKKIYIFSVSKFFLCSRKWKKKLCILLARIEWFRHGQLRGFLIATISPFQILFEKNEPVNYVYLKVNKLNVHVQCSSVVKFNMNCRKLYTFWMTDKGAEASNQCSNVSILMAFRVNGIT